MFCAMRPARLQHSHRRRRPAAYRRLGYNHLHTRTPTDLFVGGIWRRLELRGAKSNCSIGRAAGRAKTRRSRTIATSASSEDIAVGCDEFLPEHHGRRRAPKRRPAPGSGLRPALARSAIAYRSDPIHKLHFREGAPFTLPAGPRGAHAWAACFYTWRRDRRSREQAGDGRIGLKLRNGNHVSRPFFPGIYGPRSGPHSRLRSISS